MDQERIIDALAHIRRQDTATPFEGERWRPVPGNHDRAVSTAGRILRLECRDRRGRRHAPAVLQQTTGEPRMYGDSALGRSPPVDRVLLAAFDRMPEADERSQRDITDGALWLSPEAGALIWGRDMRTVHALACVRALLATTTWDWARITVARPCSRFLADQQAAAEVVPRGDGEDLRAWAARAEPELAAAVAARRARVQVAIEAAARWP